MINRLFRLSLLAALIGALTVPAAHATGRLGLGVNYWTTVDSIDVDDFDENGISWIGSVQFQLADYSRFEVALEWFEKGFGGSTEDIFAPQAFFLLGKGVYAGIGVGGYYYDSEFADDLFYALRAGFTSELLPSVFIDINGNYRFESFDSLSEEDTDIDTDTITLGAAVRLEF
jgi:hypothetical protein